MIFHQLKYLKPKYFINQYDKYQKYIALFFLTLLLISFYFIINSPDDYQQANAIKIMYVHVPSAWLALLIYSFMAIFSLMSFIYKNQTFSLISIALAPIGAVFCFITLVTGSLWGKPIWGTFWVFDARLTSTLVLFLLYLAYIAIYRAYDSTILASKIAALVAIIGFINIPIIKFSVELWNSLHQPSSFLRLEGPAIDPSMMLPLFLMFFTFIAFSYYLFIMRIKILVLTKKIARM